MPRTNSQRQRPAYQALLALVKLAGLLEKAGNRFFQAHRLTQARFNVLMALRYSAPEGCTQTELCRMLLVKGANMTALVRSLESLGLVSRDVVPGDERKWRVSITARGRRLLDRIEPDYHKTIDRIMGVHSAQVLERFSAQLERTAEAIERAGI